MGLLIGSLSERADLLDALIYEAHSTLALNELRYKGRRRKFLKDITYGVSTLFLQCVIDRGGSVEEKTGEKESD